MLPARRPSAGPVGRPRESERAAGPPFRRRSLLAGGACLAVLAPLAAVGDERLEAERFIKELGAQTLGVLNRTGADRAARIRGMAELLEKAVEFEALARIVLGRNWQRASDAQRHDYVGLFRTYTLGTLSQRLSSSTGSERFVVTGSRPAGAGDIMVNTRILYADYPPLEIAWRVRRSRQSLTIVDVIVEQVSLVVTNRSEFDSIVSQGGINGLLREMRARVNSP